MKSHIPRFKVWLSTIIISDPWQVMYFQSLSFTTCKMDYIYLTGLLQRFPNMMYSAQCKANAQCLAILVIPAAIWNHTTKRKIVAVLLFCEGSYNTYQNHLFSGLTTLSQLQLSPACGTFPSLHFPGPGPWGQV